MLVTGMKFSAFFIVFKIVKNKSDGYSCFQKIISLLSRYWWRKPLVIKFKIEYILLVTFSQQKYHRYHILQ